MSGRGRVSRPFWFGLLLTFLLAGQARFASGADTLEKIRRDGELLWGTDAEGGGPYVYPDPQKPEQIIGFELELAEAIAAKLGVKARMVQNQWDQLVPALERGNFDIILSGFEIDEEHQQRIAMSLPYFVYAQQIVTRADAGGMETPQSLTNKTVGVLQNTAGERLIRRLP